MATSELKTKQKAEIVDQSSLNKSLASIFFLGLFIVISWLAVYLFFIHFR
ncbi:cytochrome c oxidase subunit 2A [Neobacillus sp. SM06]